MQLKSDDFQVETKIVVAPQSVGIEQAKVLDSLVFGGKAIFQTGNFVILQYVT